MDMHEFEDTDYTVKVTTEPKKVTVEVAPKRCPSTRRTRRVVEQKSDNEPQVLLETEQK